MIAKNYREDLPAVPITVLMEQAEKRLGKIKLDEGAKTHGKCTDVLLNTHCQYIIFLFENGNEFVPAGTIHKWFDI